MSTGACAERGKLVMGAGGCCGCPCGGAGAAAGLCCLGGPRSAFGTVRRSGATGAGAAGAAAAYFTGADPTVACAHSGGGGGVRAGTNKLWSQHAEGIAQRLRNVANNR